MLQMLYAIIDYLKIDGIYYHRPIIESVCTSEQFINVHVLYRINISMFVPIRLCHVFVSIR